MKRGKKLNSGFSLKFILIISIIAFLVWLFLFSGFIKKKCNDKECFDGMFIGCKGAKFSTSIEGNLYEYVIKGGKGNNCILYIKLKKVGLGNSVNVVKMFEGKDMICKIPKEKLEEVSFSKMEDLVNYCSGSLKEALYELIINRMYALIISNMGEIIDKVDNELYKIK